MRKFDEWLLIRESEGGEEEVVIMQHAMDQISKVLDDYQHKVVGHINNLSSELDGMKQQHGNLSADHQKLRGDYDKLNTPQEPAAAPAAPEAAPAAPKPGVARRFLGGVANKLGSAIDTKDASGVQKNDGKLRPSGLRDKIGGWLKGAAKGLRREEAVNFEFIEAVILEYVRNEDGILLESEELRMATAEMRAQIMGVLKSALTAMYNSASTLHKYKAPGISTLGAPSSQARQYHAWLAAKQANPEHPEPEPTLRGAEKIKKRVQDHIAAQQKPGADSIRGTWLQ
jgi:hypothetical protein